MAYVAEGSKSERTPLDKKKIPWGWSVPKGENGLN